MVAEPDADWQRWWSQICVAVDAGAAPGAAAWVAVQGQVVLAEAYGLAQAEPAPEPLRWDLWFDLASVSKAIGTTSCLMALVEDGRLDLDAPVAEHLPELAEHGKGDLTARHLMRHLGGLPAWLPLYHECADREAMRAKVLATERERPIGEAVVYSDLGFLTLGFLIEAVTGERQDGFFRRRIAEPLGLANELGYGPLPPAVCVATERDDERGGIVRGAVHDENAYRCAGVAGHAGLFGKVEAVGRFGQAMLEEHVFQPATHRRLFTEQDDVAREQFWLGWKRLRYDTDDTRAFGHDGFTGTLLWVSPQVGLVVALLTNRVHPTRENRKLYDHRPDWIHQAAGLATGEPQP